MQAYENFPLKPEINAELLSIPLFFIQALIEEVDKLEAENAALKQQLRETAASLKSEIDQIKKQLTMLVKQ